MMRQRLEDLLKPRAPLGRRAFWLFALQCAGLYALALLAGRISGWPLGPVFGLLLLWPVTRIGQRRLQDVGGDLPLMYAFSVPFGFVQLVKLTSVLIPGSGAFFSQPNLGIVPHCHQLAMAAMLVLAHYWIRPDLAVQA